MSKSIIELLQSAFESALENGRESTVLITRGQYWQWLRLAKADADENARLRADNRRLRALVKEAEWYDRDDDDCPMCPWCLEYRDDHADNPTGTHHPRCRAFHPDGSVR